MQNASDVPPVLVIFGNPFTSLWNVIVQTAGDINTAEFFNAPYLIYREMSIILYVVFVFAMPILFINFIVSCSTICKQPEELSTNHLQIGISVGETGDELQIANLTIIKDKVRNKSDKWGLV